jgi:hypothetical protein
MTEFLQSEKGRNWVMGLAPVRDSFEITAHAAQAAITSFISLEIMIKQNTSEQGGLG